MKTLVCGGREYTDQAGMFAALDRQHVDKTATHVIHGGARGADTMGGARAAARGVPFTAFNAKWENGRSAGPVRNQAMLDEGKPDLVVTFAGGREADDMVRRSNAAGVEVWSIT